MLPRPRGEGEMSLQPCGHSTDFSFTTHDENCTSQDTGVRRCGICIAVSQALREEEEAIRPYWPDAAEVMRARIEIRERQARGR